MKEIVSELENILEKIQGVIQSIYFKLLLENVGKSYNILRVY